jgi:uncharacterized membrane protein HdeD (DUF308 family)
MADTTFLDAGRHTGLPGRGWQIAWGALLLIAGVLALMMPAVAALATALFLAWLLMLGGVFEIGYAVQTRSRPGFGWKLASGVLTLLLGIAIGVVPLAGVASLALLVGGFLLAGGIARVVLALRTKPLRGWGWVLFDGALSIVLAVLILLGWPHSSLAIIGLMTGFSLIFTGVWRILLARQSAP